jgi:hypothetical protein
MKILSGLIFLVAIESCSSVILKPADFYWPIESVLKVDNKGYIEDQRYSIIFKVKTLFFIEFADSNNFAGKEMRFIRDKNGYCYMTGKDFKNVYVLFPVEGGFKLCEKILISEEKGLLNPAFNQKSPYIELIDGKTKYLLQNKGIVR